MDLLVFRPKLTENKSTDLLLGPSFFDELTLVFGLMAEPNSPRLHGSANVTSIPSLVPTCLYHFKL